MGEAVCELRHDRRRMFERSYMLLSVSHNLYDLGNQIVYRELQSSSSPKV